MNKRTLLTTLNDVERVDYKAMNGQPIRISKNKECFWCREKGGLYISHYNSHTYYNIAGKMRKIILKKYPAIKCSNCDRKTTDVEVENKSTEINDIEKKKSIKASKFAANTNELDRLI